MSRPDYIVEEQGLTGTVKWFNITKGYGFIGCLDYETDIFFHLSHALGDYEPTQGDRVSFSLANDKRRNRTYAVEVQLA